MPEVQLPPSSDGGVVLDIGGNIGALVLMTTSELDRAEIDLTPDSTELPHVHSAVRRRDLAGGDAAYAAVYPTLHEGTYSIEGSNQRVTIVGGEVAQLTYEPTDHVHHDHEHGDHGHDHEHGHDHHHEVVNATH